MSRKELDVWARPPRKWLRSCWIEHKLGLELLGARSMSSDQVSFIGRALLLGLPYSASSLRRGYSVRRSWKLVAEEA